MCILATFANMPSLPVLYANGTHYEVGREVGRTFKDRIKAYFDDFSDLSKKFLPFYQSDAGRKIYDGYLKVVETVYPQYVEEIKGISVGSGIPFVEVFLMHIRVELQTYMETEVVPECSTVLVNNENNWILAHNEDTSQAVFDRGYVLIADIREEGPKGLFQTCEERFLAYCYPGIVPGNSFSYNSKGVVLSVNALYPKIVQTEKLPRQFINRAMLAAESQENLIQILTAKGYGIATGCSVNTTFHRDKSSRPMFSVELCPLPKCLETRVSKLDVNFGADGHYCHFNMYQHMPDVVEMEGRTTSSEHRKKRADALPVPMNVDSVLNILGDDQDKEYPIYRVPSKTDPGCTVTTGVFDLLNQQLSIYVGNPKMVRPVLHMKFPWKSQAN